MTIIMSCSNDDDNQLQESVLSEYIEMNTNVILDDVIACAGGKEDGLFGPKSEPTSIFFLPIDGAKDIRYYEAINIEDSLDFSKYSQIDLDSDPIFNGYLRKFKNISFTGERMGIVTYKTSEILHVSTPIRLKTSIKPTEVNSNLVSINVNGLNPIFNWQDGEIKENVIYFQVVSDSNGNLISGTYTFEKQFTFYDLSNVVLNITDTNSNPELKSNMDYKFTMMGVSEDNWVNLFIEKEFSTN